MSAANVSPEIGDKILSLGLLYPIATLPEMVAAAGAAGPEVAAELLYRNKVISIAGATLKRAVRTATPDDRPILTETAELVAQRAARMAARWQSSDEVFGKVMRFAEAEGISWRTMKGFSFRPLYRDLGQRDVRDLDVWVATMDAAWPLARRLRGAGYGYPEWELPWFKKDVSTGEFYGQIKLSSPARDRLSVDIHAGPYSVRHCAVMSLGRTGPGENGTPISFDDDVCVAVANAAGDCFITGKLLNDLVLAASIEIDTEYVQESLDRAGLLPFLATCLHRVRELCRLTDEQSERIGLLTPAVQAEPAPAVFGADQDQRCVVTVAHTQTIAGRLFPAEDPHVTAIVAGARQAYEAERPLYLTDDDDASAAAGLPALNNWTCVRLVPRDLAMTLLSGPPPGPASDGGRKVESLTGQMSAQISDDGLVIRAAGEIFVPTVDYSVPKRLLASLGGS